MGVGEGASEAFDRAEAGEGGVVFFLAAALVAFGLAGTTSVEVSVDCKFFSADNPAAFFLLVVILIISYFFV